MKNAIVYLHGFASAGDLEKLKPLQARLPNYDFYSPTYSPHDSAATLEYLKNYLKKLVKQYDNVVLIGSSMGGFWADFFGRMFGLKIILLNPNVEAANMQQFLGKTKNYATGQEVEVTSKHIQDLERVNSLRKKLAHVPRAVMVNKDDEIIPYQQAHDEFAKNSKVIAFDRGGHRWTNWDAVADELSTLAESIIL